MTKHPSPHENRFGVGVLAVLLASMLSSIGWIFEGEAVARLAPLPIACVCHLLGGAALVVWGAFVRRKLKRRILPDIFRSSFILYSVFRSGLISLLFAYCLTLSSSTKIMFLTKVEPYLVLLIQVLFYGHRTTMTHIVLLAIHLVGAVVLSTGGALSLSVDTVGDLLLLVGVFANAVLYAPSQRFAHEMGVLSAGGFSQLIGGLALAPFMLIWYADMFSSTPEFVVGWKYAVATVLVFHILATALWFLSLKEIPAWLASALRCVGPVIAAPIAWFVFDKPLTGVQTLGACVVVATSLWMVVLERRR